MLLPQYNHLELQIREIEILSCDLNATQKFYNEKLGFKTVTKNNDALTLQAGHSLITFIKTTIKAVYHFAFNIPHNQLEEAIHWAEPRVELIPVQENKIVADFDNWNAKAFYFFDNNGNILEFLTRFDLPNASEEKFEAKSIIGLSEIAIVTKQVSQCAEQLNKNFNIPFFVRQPPLPNFTVLGDDNGLLIISEEKRHWYPTEIVCEKFYTKIKLREEGKDETLIFNETERH